MSNLPQSEPTRRGVLTVAAWSVPVVGLATAAPAYASSPASCVPLSYRLDWESSTWSYDAGARTGTANAVPAESVPEGAHLDPLVMTVTNEFFGGMETLTVGTAGRADYVANMQLSGEPNIGGTGAKGFAMAQRLSTNHPRYNAGTNLSQSATHEDRQTITFSFDRDVTNLSFTVTDIDAYLNTDRRVSYRDAVYLSVAPDSATHTSRVVGGGTAANPWLCALEPTMDTHPNRSSLPNDQAGAGVDVVLDGPVRTFSLTFWNRETGRISSATRGQQAIFLTNFAFNASSCRS